MKCAEMLTLLLEAEREELEGKGTSLAASHVRECARCRAVASRLLSDTMVLAAHTAGHGISATRGRPNVARPFVWSGALVAVGVVAFLVMSVRMEEHRVQPVRFPEAVAATPVRFVASQTTEQPITPVESNGVSVAPPAGTRSAVLATRNAKITVVWLY